MKDIKLILSKKNTLNSVFSFVLALIISSIPWGYLRSAGIADRANYIRYIDIDTNKILWFDFSGFLTKISYEWGWHYFLNYMKSQLGFDSSIILFLVSVFFLTISFILISSRKSFYLCFLLINPIYIDFFYAQVRLCFAIAFIFLSIIAFNKNKYLSVGLLIPSLFIHTSSFLFVFIFYSAIFITKTSYINQRNKFLISLFVGLICAFATGPYMSILLGSFDDRRADYKDMSSSTLYMVYWIGLFLFFIFKYFSNKIQSLNYYYFYITVSILTMVVLNIFLIGYASRFLAASLPFLVLTISELKGKNEFIIVLLYIFYVITLWFFWLT